MATRATRRTMTTVGLGGLFCLLAGLAWADGSVARVTGQVRVAGNGAPIPGATVSLSPGGATTQTDRAGHFQLSTTQTGRATLTVGHPRFKSWRGAVSLMSGSVQHVQVRLSPIHAVAKEPEATPTVAAQRPAKPYERARPASDRASLRPRAEKRMKHHGKMAYGVGAGLMVTGQGAGGGYRSHGYGRGRPAPMMRRDQSTSREGYEHTPDGDFHQASQRPLSTFSIDVDTASFSNVRRFIVQNRRLPPADAVRIEELLNYFPYNTPEPSGNAPFGVAVELTPAPWNPAHRLVRIAVQGRKVAVKNLPPANLVFLVDVSGSMHSADKLPLLKRSLAMLSQQLRPQDRVSIVVYAGAAGLVLPPTSGDEQQTILRALSSLRAGGSTAGGAGLRLAYNVARRAFRKNGNNRVILCTDGDFNVGQSSDGALVRMIEQERSSGIFLTVLGFGSGNYQDAKMQKLADKGNGNHAYIDSLMEARKVLVEQIGGTLLTIAKDVKIQVEFNPSRVASYRLIGYANRKLAARDFNDDKKDAGELGAGHHVTALYEIVPAGGEAAGSGLRYQKRRSTSAAASGELMHVKLRWKSPRGSKSKLASFPVSDLPGSLAQASEDHRFAVAVAGFGMLLRKSKHIGSWRWSEVLALAQGATGADSGGHRAAFVQLAHAAARLSGVRPTDD